MWRNSLFLVKPSASTLDILKLEFRVRLHTDGPYYELKWCDGRQIYISQTNKCQAKENSTNKKIYLHRLDAKPPTGPPDSIGYPESRCRTRWTCDQRSFCVAVWSGPLGRLGQVSHFWSHNSTPEPADPGCSYGSEIAPLGLDDLGV